MKRRFRNLKLKALSSTFAVIVGAMGVTGVAYADSTSVADDMVSVGVFNYDSDGDGEYDIILDARDIDNLAEAVDTLNTEYTTAISTLSANKYALVQAMDATVTAKDPILSSGATDADDISFDTIISTISNLQTPSTATASYYAGGVDGDNSTNGYLADSGSAATSSSVSSGTATINLNTSGESDLTLGVNEAVTLESGYYSDPVTISNGVVNRGTLNFSPSGSETQTLKAGFYEGGTLDSSVAYNEGYADGVNDGSTGQAVQVLYETKSGTAAGYSGVTTGSFSASLSMSTPSGYTYIGCTNYYANPSDGITFTSKSISPSSSSPTCSFAGGLFINTTHGYISYGCTFIFVKLN